ncbi:MAG: ATP synthase F0 subunit B [Candidatus Kaiserbacteria bacterium]|nr:ATP synthase F0 subunit B [Candidatus Kaiserbacteria bacterium]
MEEILTVFGIEWHYITIQIVNFSIVLILLRLFLYRPVLSLLEKRKKQIDKSLLVIDEAQHAKQETETMREQVMKEAYGQSEDIVRKAKETSQAQRNTLMEEAERERRDLATKQRSALMQEKKAMLADVDREAAKIAVLAAEKILREKA